MLSSEIPVCVPQILFAIAIIYILRVRDFATTDVNIFGHFFAFFTSIVVVLCALRPFLDAVIAFDT